MGMIINRRRVMGGGGGTPLPYDAEIEYLKGDGHAYIILPFTGYSDKTTFELELRAIKGVSTALIGSRKNTNSRFCWSTNPDNFTQVGYGDQYYNIDISILQNDIVNIKTEIVGSSIKYTITNKTTGISEYITFPLATFDVLNYIYLFWFGALNRSMSSIIKCIIKNENTTVIDSYPVRVGQTGYMYDKVSKQLFGNAGTGAFILGPDKNSVTIITQQQQHEMYGE